MNKTVKAMVLATALGLMTGCVASKPAPQNRADDRAGTAPAELAAHLDTSDQAGVTQRRGGLSRVIRLGGWILN
jgi:hypothetical protein